MSTQQETVIFSSDCSSSEVSENDGRIETGSIKSGSGIRGKHLLGGKLKMLDSSFQFQYKVSLILKI